MIQYFRRECVGKALLRLIRALCAPSPGRIRIEAPRVRTVDKSHSHIYRSMACRACPRTHSPGNASYNTALTSICAPIHNTRPNYYLPALRSKEISRSKQGGPSHLCVIPPPLSQLMAKPRATAIPRSTVSRHMRTQSRGEDFPCIRHLSQQSSTPKLYL